MTQREAKRISEKTLHSFADFADSIEGHAPYVYEMRKKKGSCVFLDEASCTIYSYRPLVCRFYPFELKPEERGGYIFSYTNECLGIGRGKRMTRRVFQEFLNDAKDRLC
jgi:Fe-S-cluster containining protein